MVFIVETVVQPAQTLTVGVVAVISFVCLGLFMLQRRNGRILMRAEVGREKAAENGRELYQHLLALELAETRLDLIGEDDPAELDLRSEIDLSDGADVSERLDLTEDGADPADVGEAGDVSVRENRRR